MFCWWCKHARARQRVGRDGWEKGKRKKRGRVCEPEARARARVCVLKCLPESEIFRALALLFSCDPAINASSETNVKWHKAGAVWSAPRGKIRAALSSELSARIVNFKPVSAHWRLYRLCVVRGNEGASEWQKIVLLISYEFSEERTSAIFMQMRQFN